MAQVHLRGVKKTYDNKVAVIHGIDMEIADGEFIVIVGPSGCGKSTLLRMVAGLERITGGEVKVRHSLPHHFDLMTRAFRKLGVVVEHKGDTAVVRRGQALEIEAPFTTNLLPKIEAAPWPYFPVDLLPCMIALSVRARGAMQFWHKVYEGGFTWMPELAKFGAHVVVSDPHRVIVFGDRPLRPATVDAPYIIRAAVGLYMVAASIPGRSVVKNADTIRRAHPHFVENLRSLGADVEWRE